MRSVPGFTHCRPLLRAPFLLFPLTLTLLAPSWAFTSDGSQETPSDQASTPRPTLEGARGWAGLFGGVSTASADGLENGPLFGGSGAFYFLKRLGIEVGVQRRSLDAVGTSSNALSGGSLDSTIITGSFVVRFPISPRVTPYFVGGVAYFSNKLEVDPAVSRELAALNFRVTEEVKSALGFNVGGGVNVLVVSRFGLFGEVRYLGASTDTRAELADTISGTTAGVGGSQDLNGLEIRVGIRLVFQRTHRKEPKS